MKEEFKILSPREHVRTRTGMYLGSTARESLERFVVGDWKSIEYVPALNKMVDEIIDNAIDEAIRTKFKKANQISVSVKGNSITIEDNGRGIPQEKVIDHTGETVLRPVAAWTKTNAGTSFDDSRTTIGANGVGSACTNFMSMKFVGETWQKKNLVKVSCKDGANDIVVLNKPSTGSGTRVTFTPDFTLFGVDRLDDVHTEELIQDRLTSLQIAFPEIKFKFNKKRIAESNIKKYASLFLTDPDASTVFNATNDLSYFFASSEDGFKTTSYINGVNTRLGGTYVDFIMNEVVEILVKLIKRKFKIDVTKSTIKGGLTFVMFARNFIDPKYDSQTKERLTSNISGVKEHYNKTDSIDFEKIAKKLMGAEDIIGPIVEAQLAKKLAADKRAATLAQKKLKKIKVPKHIAASGPDGTLFLCEGDSAIGYLLKVRNPKTVGGFPLRGVVMNTWNMKPADVLKNKELSELVAVLGLNINDPDSIDEMTYKNIAILADADHDGNHIGGLLIAFFYKFWPRLYEEKRVHLTRTPIMISSRKQDVYWYYSYKDAKEFKGSDESKGFYHRYIKGLASLTEEEYHAIINEPEFSTIVIDDDHQFEIMFGAEASLRKVWLTT
jgi:DNA topoisomerase-2|tara:strand:+ start:3156 stop:4988 length:1833 start_codon:yes stop_codon:yes gene_type:complete